MATPKAKELRHQSDSPFFYPFSTFYTHPTQQEHFPSVEHPGGQNQTSLDVLVGNAVTD